MANQWPLIFRVAQRACLPRKLLPLFRSAGFFASKLLHYEPRFGRTSSIGASAAPRNYENGIFRVYVSGATRVKVWRAGDDVGRGATAPLEALWIMAGRGRRAAPRPRRKFRRYHPSGVFHAPLYEASFFDWPVTLALGLPPRTSDFATLGAASVAGRPRAPRYN